MYGQQAIDYIHEPTGRIVALALGFLVLVGGVAYYVWKRRGVQCQPKRLQGSGTLGTNNEP